MLAKMMKDINTDKPILNVVGTFLEEYTGTVTKKAVIRQKISMRLGQTRKKSSMLLHNLTDKFVKVVQQIIGEINQRTENPGTKNQNGKQHSYDFGNKRKGLLLYLRSSLKNTNDQTHDQAYQKHRGAGLEHGVDSFTGNFDNKLRTHWETSVF
jgi:hypothetical protein